MSLVSERERGVLELLLEEQEQQKRYELLREACIRAAIRGQDQEALDYFELTLKALEEYHLEPKIIVQTEGSCLIVDDDLPALQEAAKRNQANCAADIHDQIWAHGDVSKLPSTIKRILGVIAGRWRDTKDQEEAEAIFKYLVKLSSWAFASELIEKVFRETLNDHFPMERLALHLRLLVTGQAFAWTGNPNRFDALVRILSVARARQQSKKDLERELEIAVRLRDCSANAWNFIQRTADWIVDADREARELEQRLAAEFPADRVNVLIAGQKAFEAFVDQIWDGGIMGSDEAAGNDQFENAARVIKKWSRGVNFSVRLRLRARWSSSETFVFIKEERVQ